MKNNNYVSDLPKKSILQVFEKKSEDSRKSSLTSTIKGMPRWASKLKRLRKT